MFFSKIWFFVIAVVAMLALGGALLMTKPAHREINKANAIGLDRMQHNAELLLRLSSRDWIDAVASLARDRKVVDVLEQATDRRGDTAQLKARATDRLLALINKLQSERRPELLIAVDIRGKQVARIGPGDTKFKPGRDGVAGYPLVEAALRGYRRDDTWNVDGKLYMMVASPVISRARARYVGAVILGRAITNEYAQRMKARLGGANLMFFLRGSVVSTTLTSASLTRLPRQYERRRQQIQKDGRSPALVVGSGDDAHNVILAALPGEAGHHDAFYAVIAPPTPAFGVTDMVGMIRGQDVTTGQLLLLGGGLVVILVVGIGLMVMEGDLPARRFHKSVEDLGKGELSRLDDREFTGRYGSMARALNAGLDRAEKRAPAGKDIGRILGSPAEQGTRPDLKLDPSFSSMPPLAPIESFGNTLDERPEGPHGPPPEPPVVDERELRRRGPPSDSGVIQTADIEEASTELSPPRPPETELPSLADGAAGSFGLEPSMGSPAFEEAPSNRKIRIPESELTPSGMPPSEGSGIQELPPLDDPLNALDEPPPLEPLSEEEAPTLEPEPEPEPEPEQPPPAEEPSDEAAELAEYFEQVYNQFVAVKRQCGESTDNLTLERFEKKLQQNRDNLIERYKCKSVKFQVYIKDGKAAIKATPIKE
jgi:hypothetical protein